MHKYCAPKCGPLHWSEPFQSLGSRAFYRVKWNGSCNLILAPSTRLVSTPALAAILCWAWLHAGAVEWCGLPLFTFASTLEGTCRRRRGERGRSSAESSKCGASVHVVGDWIFETTLGPHLDYCLYLLHVVRVTGCCLSFGQTTQCSALQVQACAPPVGSGSCDPRFSSLTLRLLLTNV